MRAIKTVGIVAIVMVAAIVVYQVVINNRHLPQTAEQSPDNTDNSAPSVVEKSTQPVPEPVKDDIASEESLEAGDELAQEDSAPNEVDNLQPNPNYPPLAAYDVATEPLNDQELTG